jgi:hypothetical protein
MNIRKFIFNTLRDFLNESKSYPFVLNIQNKVYNGFPYRVFTYEFKVEDIDYVCVIYPNAFRINENIFDIDFITKGGSTNDVVGKDLNFMNSVLKTVGECIIDFINKNNVIKKIRFQSHGIREKAYIRFFKTHPYFSQFEIDSSYNHSGFVEIHINKETN